jgi:hypothetical protein
MNPMKRWVPVAAFVFVLSTAHAQVTGAAGSGSPPQVLPSVATGSPVAIAYERTTVQTLADGTHISRTTQEWFYRDIHGRTRRELELESPAGRPEIQRTSVIVTDPVAGETLSWMSGDSTKPLYAVSKFPRPGQVNVDPGLRPAAPVPAAQNPPQRPVTHRQNLGIQEVQGAPCQANRVTTTYAVGMLGNDRPITVVREDCTSREFGVTLRELTDDPRSGVRTLTVTLLVRTDPEAPLFSPPPGYSERPSPVPINPPGGVTAP